MPGVRILHLPKWYPNRYDDQDGDFVARHVAAIAAAPGPDGARLQTAVVFAAVAKGPLSQLIEVETELSGPVPTWRYYYRARLTGLGPLDRLLKVLLWLLCMARGVRAVRQHWGGQQPHLVHAHILLRPAVLAWWLKRRHGIPYLITEHWTIFLPVNRQRLPWLHRRLAGVLVRQAAAFTSVSQDLKAAFQQMGGENARTVIIPNVVDTNLFHLPAAAAPRRGLLNVAVFNEQAKNLSGLLRTVAHLRTAYPELGMHLRIAGFGAAEKQLLTLADNLGLRADGTVEFLGKLSSAEVAREMRRAACFVLFSNYENLPCVLIEAQASGLPAVATRVNGVPELLPNDGSRGLLVPPRDEAALAAAILNVLRQPGQFDAAALRAHAEAHYSVPAIGQQFRTLYQQVLAP